MKYTDIKVQPLKNHKYKVLQEIRYKDVYVPAGYRTNGADIPRVFWWLFPPNDSDILPAVIVHDFLCDAKKYHKADNYFLAIMVELKVNKIKRTLMYKSVSLYTRFIRR